MCGVVFFFFKQKTAYEMRISDWSSDVCSSDLDGSAVVARLEHRQLARLAAHGPLYGADDVATLAQRAQSLFRVGMDGPGARLHLVGEAHALQALQATDQQ